MRDKVIAALASTVYWGLFGVVALAADSITLRGVIAGVTIYTFGVLVFMLGDNRR